MLLLACLFLAGPGCASSRNRDRSPPDVTIDNPRAARLAGSWIGFDQSANAPYEFMSATFQKRGDYTAVIYSSGEQIEHKGRWRVLNDVLVLGQQRWELEFRGENLVVLRDAEARVFHQLARRR